MDGSVSKLPLKMSIGLAGIVAMSSLAGLGFVAAYSAVTSNWMIFIVASLIALAAAAVFAVAGFAFGLPRYGVRPREGEVDSRSGSVLVPGNNLEQIADWLTKVLIGAGLVQLSSIGEYVGSTLDALSAAINGSSTLPPLLTKAVLGSILALYSAIGFIFGYIVTTLWYRRRLEGRDAESTGAVT